MPSPRPSPSAPRSATLPERWLRGLAVVTSIGLGLAVVIHAQPGCSAAPERAESPAPVEAPKAAEPATPTAAEPAAAEPAAAEPAAAEPEAPGELPLHPRDEVADAPGDRFFPASKSGIHFGLREEPPAKEAAEDQAKPAPTPQAANPPANARNQAPNARNPTPNAQQVAP